MVTSSWIRAPAARCIEFVAEETKIAALLQRSLTHIEMGRPLFELVKKQFQLAGQPDSAVLVDTLLDSAPHHEDWARLLRQQDYAPLNAHSVISMWGALETCVEDTVVAILTNDPSAAAALESVGLRQKRVGSNDEDRDLRKVYKALENKRRIAGNVIATFESVLCVFGLSADVPDNRETLLELNAVRNCLVHRGGIIDEKAVSEAPSLLVLKGTEIKIGSKDFLRYNEAVSAWVITLLKSIGQSPYVTATAPVTQPPIAC